MNFKNLTLKKIGVMLVSIIGGILINFFIMYVVVRTPDVSRLYFRYVIGFVLLGTFLVLIPLDALLKSGWYKE